MTGGDLAGAFDDLMYLMFVGIVLLIIFVPLGLWKLIEVILWCYRHFHFAIS